MLTRRDYAVLMLGATLFLTGCAMLAKPPTSPVEGPSVPEWCQAPLWCHAPPSVPAVRSGVVREVTGYTSTVAETDSTPEIAANGQNIWTLYQRGEMTCATNAFPFGTRLSVDGLGVCVVRDLMNRRYRERVDWYFGKDRGAARRHGLQRLFVTTP